LGDPRSPHEGIDVLYRINLEGGARRVLVSVSRVVVYSIAGEPEGFFIEDRDVRLILIERV
jgi:hypothetical protein